MRTSVPELSDGFRGKFVTTKCCTCGNGCIRVRNFVRRVVSVYMRKYHWYVKGTSAKKDCGYKLVLLRWALLFHFQSAVTFKDEVYCASLEIFFWRFRRRCTRRM